MTLFDTKMMAHRGEIHREDTYKNGWARTRGRMLKDKNGLGMNVKVLKEKVMEEGGRAIVGVMVA